MKLKIIAFGAADLQRQGDHRLQGLFASVAGGDNQNLSKTLATGIRDARAGGIFMGSAIDHITEIRSVQDIVDSLVATLEAAPALSPAQGER